MPELPEVETIRRQLAPELEGRTVETVEVLDPRWTLPGDPAATEGALAGSVVERVGRRGKYLIWSLSGDRHLVTHLRMTGAYLWDPESEPSHTRVRFGLSGGHRIAYVDPRRFGTGHLLDGTAALEAYLDSRLGPEPLTAEFTMEYLRGRGRGRTAPIKAFLLDQRNIAGVGNIYADEALFRAGVHPLRAAGRLSASQWAAVRDGVEDALAAGIAAKGASIDDFRHVDGARGSFQDRFLVHRRAGEPCPRCGGEVRKIVVGGRGTYVCERCQPRPRQPRAGRPSQPRAARPSQPRAARPSQPRAARPS